MISRCSASARASCCRCSTCGESSGPRCLPRESKIACSSAAHPAVRSPLSFPAPPKVVPSRRYRSSNPSSSPCPRPLPSSGSGCCAFHVSSIVAGQDRQVFQRQPRPRRRPAGSRSASSRFCGGQLVSPAGDRPCAQDSVMPPAAITAAILPCRARRLCQPYRAARRALGHRGAVDQPCPRDRCPSGLVPRLRGESRQHRSVDRGQLGLRPLQPGQHLPVRCRAQRRPVGRGQVIQGCVQQSRPRRRSWRIPLPASGSPPRGPGYAFDMYR